MRLRFIYLEEFSNFFLTLLRRESKSATLNVMSLLSLWQFQRILSNEQEEKKIVDCILGFSGGEGIFRTILDSGRDLARIILPCSLNFMSV